MNRRAFLALAVTFSGCLEPFRGNGDEIREPEDLEIVWSDLVRDDPGTEEERVYVWGIVRNQSDRELSYVEIRATFLDGEGEELDTVIENVEDVTSGEEWEFEIEFPDFGERAAEVADYELEPATGV
ncbi:FxLYD domain-containing protein [Salinilacihabitans rarus]|uniref:FxLYD domain-containing protein n=1 Tax=Salinilacihabitans rarus TaxID=2961596 RepID=UPI0020C8F8FC|nr:FxLYD domain-containing protein [Salinilacihabitans rarus]